LSENRKASDSLSRISSMGFGDAFKVNKLGNNFKKESKDSEDFGSVFGKATHKNEKSAGRPPTT
jgi:hypothetical protein